MNRLFESLKSLEMNAASGNSLGVKVHISDTIAPSSLPEALRLDKRVIVVAFDESSESQYSLSWTLDNIFTPESDILILLSIAIFHEPYLLVRSIVGSEPEKKQLFAEDFSSRLSSVASSIIEDHQIFVKVILTI